MTTLDRAPCVLDGVVVADGRIDVASDGGFAVAGEGVFESLPVIDGRPKFLALHRARLHRGAELLGLGAAPGEDVIRADVALLANARGVASFALRYTMFEDAGRTRRLAVASPLPAPVETPVAVVRAAPPFDGPRPVASVKSINYLVARLALREALARGADEALFVAADGSVLEGTRSNVFCVFDGVLTTPPKAAALLPGVVRDVVIACASERGVPFRERAFRVEDVFAADEAFLTSSLRGPRAIGTFEGRPLGGPKRPVFENLNAGYRARLAAD